MRTQERDGQGGTHSGGDGAGEGMKEYQGGETDSMHSVLICTWHEVRGFQLH